MGKTNGDPLITKDHHEGSFVLDRLQTTLIQAKKETKPERKGTIHPRKTEQTKFKGNIVHSNSSSDSLLLCEESDLENNTVEH